MASGSETSKQLLGSCRVLQKRRQDAWNQELLSTIAELEEKSLDLMRNDGS